MNIFILTFHKYDKAFASDLYLIYNRSPAARVCKSDTDRLLMLYLVHNPTSHICEVGLCVDQVNDNQQLRNYYTVEHGVLMFYTLQRYG